MTTIPLHILSLNSSADFGGLERFQLAVAAGLAARGHRVTFAGRPGGPLMEAAAGAGLTVLPERFHGYLSPLAAIRLARLIRRTGCDAVHYCLSRNIWPIAPAARLAGMRGRVVHSLCMTPGGRLDNPLHRWLRRTLGAFVTPSPRTAEQAARVWGMEADEPIVIPNFVRRQPFEDAGLEARAASMRASWGVPAGRPLAGMLARLEPSKGVSEFVEAALLPGTSGFGFLVGGPTSDGHELFVKGLESRVRERGASDRIRFVGRVEDVPAFMRAVDLFVLPSHRETFGLVLVEAMLAGTATLSTRGPGPDFILDGGRAGRLAAAADPSALGEAAVGLLQDGPARTRLAEAGRERARALFSEEAVLPLYEALFMEVAGRTRPALSEAG